MGRILYVIGNGFDLAHGFKTSYRDFAEYLQINYPELHEQLESNCYLDKDLWSNFEEALGALDLYTLADSEEPDPLTDPSLDKGSRQSLYAYEDTTKENLGYFLEQLTESFFYWISSVDCFTNPRLNFNEKAKYLSFNYTETLKLIYGISDVLHIHGCVDDAKSIILGHVNIKEIKDSFFENINDIFNGINDSLRKNVENIYDANKGFFDNLSDINEVVILGHSLSDVESLYFQKICSKVNLDDCKFYVSYYDKNEVDSKKEFLTNLGVKEENIRFSTISKISDMMDESNLKLDFKD